MQGKPKMARRFEDRKHHRTGGPWHTLSRARYSRLTRTDSVVSTHVSEASLVSGPLRFRRPWVFSSRDRPHRHSGSTDFPENLASQTPHVTVFCRIHDEPTTIPQGGGCMKHTMAVWISSVGLVGIGQMAAPRVSARE
jgi:hypothetical protein